MPVDCRFSAAGALGYVVPSWSHDMNVTRGDAVLTVTLEVEGETVESFGASKRAVFRATMAEVLGVDVSSVEVAVFARSEEEPLEGSLAGSSSYGSHGSGEDRRLSGGGIEIVVTIRSSEVAAVAAASEALRDEAFGAQLTEKLEHRGVELAGSVRVDADSVVVEVEAGVGAPTAAPTASPTRLPTQSPTRSPTTSPTLSPTQSPTISPTGVPTPQPTPLPLCDVRSMSQAKVDCMLSGGCALPEGCHFSAAAALGYDVSSWSHDMDLEGPPPTPRPTLSPTMSPTLSPTPSPTPNLCTLTCAAMCSMGSGS
ncbi:MAG: PT domain-containing protein, partial [Candidatus Thermoplasmatota archaeon]|nr:PT domain-containing protein [Candidatus Thermoplasmatota archaeon]